MGKFILYGNKTSDITKREINHRELARKVASEGIVLLKNEGVLPLNEKKIALFGSGARMTIKGGTGSGDVQERYSVNIEQGLKNLGVEIASTRWLDRFDLQYENEKKLWRVGIEKRIKKYAIWQTQKMFDEVIHVTPLKFPIGDLIEDDDMPDCKTAIYVIARQAGESNDRSLEKGDYYLSDVEVSNIKILSQKYDNLILVINCGSQIDLCSIDDLKISALIFMGQGGEEGGSALADILIGNVSPSGKLTDTWAYKYEDYSSSNQYGVLGDVLNQDYQEGIYVGYRYFDSFNIDVRYPFGYGMSYTNFEIETKAISVKKTKVTINIEVKNVGTEFSGKEVVQLYLRKPQTEIETELHTLCAFVKTKELYPSETQKVLLSFDLLDFAVYDETRHSYILPHGEYGLYLGNSIINLKLIGILKVDKTTIVERCKNICKLNEDFKEITRAAIEYEYDKKIQVYDIDLSSFKCVEHKYDELKPIIRTKQTEKYLKELKDEELIELTIGGGYTGKSYNVTPTVAGRTSINLLKRGIPNVNLSDGPAGLRLAPKNAFTKGGSPRYIDNVPEDWQWGWIKKFEKLFLAKEGKGLRVYQYMTAFPCATLQAQTFNINLIEEVGKAIGTEMIETGVTLWLAPGMNIHRNPLCGRNFEYYSEDPFVSGVMAAAITNGVQSHKGVGVTIKHFCCNNQEDKREYMSSNVKERTLREIYLKGFEIAIKRSNPKSIMTSYNKLNGVYTSNNYDLCISLLRGEWNYQGLVMTDWTATGDKKAKHKLCHKTGNDLIEPGGKTVRKEMLKAYKKEEIDMNLIKVSAANILNLIFESNVHEIKGRNHK